MSVSAEEIVRQAEQYLPALEWGLKIFGVTGPLATFTAMLRRCVDNPDLKARTITYLRLLPGISGGQAMPPLPEEYADIKDDVELTAQYIQQAAAQAATAATQAATGE